MAASPDCLRSLGATLIAAASTSALFVAGNWSLTFFLTDSINAEPADRGDMRVFLYTVLGLATPLFPLYMSVANAIVVWTVKRSLRMQLHERNDPADQQQEGGGHNIHLGSIAIITLCPILIIFPAAARSELVINGDMVGYRRITNLRKLQDDLCPMELRPAPSKRAGSAAAATAEGNMNNIISTANGGAADEIVGTADNELHSTQLECWEVPVRSGDTVELALKERAALLRAGLAPKYNELRMLRSRSKFQSVVTAFQASGYMLTVLQRMAQHLEISPVEVITTCLCIIFGLQLLIELYANSHYQRPLLLRLTSPQLRSFLDAPREDIIFISQSRSLLIFALTYLLPSLLVLVTSMYYFIHYLHASHHHCRICSLTALFFFLSQLIVYILMFFLASGLDEIVPGCLQCAMFTCGCGMCMCSMVLAVVATTVKWAAFHEATQQNGFAWLLPHVSAG